MNTEVKYIYSIYHSIKCAYIHCTCFIILCIYTLHLYAQNYETCFECGMSHVWTWRIRMSHVTHKHEPCQVVSITSHTCISDVVAYLNTSRSHINESCQTFEKVMSHISMSTSQICMQHVTRVNELCRHTCQHASAMSTKCIGAANDLHWVAVSCSELQWVVISCSELQWVAVSYAVTHVNTHQPCLDNAEAHQMICSELQWVVVNCSVLQWVAVQWVAVSCSKLCRHTCQHASAMSTKCRGASISLTCEGLCKVFFWNWKRHVHTYECTHVNESCHTCGWAMSHVWMSHVNHVNESCHACKWVMSHMWKSHVTHMNESCHTHR